MIFIDKCYQAMEAAGLSPAGGFQIISDGVVHRFQVEGDRRGTSNGWYICHDDNVFIFGSWKTDQKIIVFKNDSSELSSEQRRIHQLRMKEARQKFNEEKRRNHEAVANDSVHIWEQSKPIFFHHPYLWKKGVSAFGIREYRNQIVVPMRDAQGKLWSLQYIGPNGRKRFAKGGRVDGLFHLMGQVDDAIYFCEGYSTGATLHQYLGVTVAIAFNAGNLLKAAEELRTIYPDTKMVFAADNDRYTKGNPGITKARAAAGAVNGKLIWPKFPEGMEGTDFNDLMLGGGFAVE